MPYRVASPRIWSSWKTWSSTGGNGTKPRRARSYRIIVDRKPYVVSQHEMTGSQILALVGKSSDGFSLTEKLHGGKRVRIELGTRWWISRATASSASRRRPSPPPTATRGCAAR